MTKPTMADAEKTCDGGNDGSHESYAKLPEDHDLGFHQSTTVDEDFLKEGENVDEKKVLNLKSDNGGEANKESYESLVSDAGWVCKSPNAVLGWPSTKPSPPTVSAEEQATIAALDLQLKALEACHEYLVGKAGSDSEEDVIDSESEEEDESEDDDDDSEESKEYKFFERVFKEDVELRRYYENNYKDGVFYCLVCGAVWKKVWKRFKDCTALIQHSTTVLRTKRMRAHRAYAQFICKLLGWDIDQLPAIVLKDSDSSLAGSKKHLVATKKPAGSPIDDSNGEPGNADGHVDGHVDDSVVIEAK